MSEESRKRHFVSLDVLDEVRDFSLAFLEVGSVAYAPEAVTEKSDLDLVAVMDFSKVDFQELYKRLGQEPESPLIEYAKNQDINTFSIVWDHERGFEVGLHLWDTTAFWNVTLLAGPNKVFARNQGPTKHFVSTATTELRYSLTGEEKKFEKPHYEVEGGRIVDLPTCHYDESGFYPGLQTTNLILKPIALHQKDGFGTPGFISLDRILSNIVEKEKKRFGKNKVSMYNAMPPKMRAKIHDDLRKILDDFY